MINFLWQSRYSGLEVRNNKEIASFHPSLMNDEDDSDFKEVSLIPS